MNKKELQVLVESGKTVSEIAKISGMTKTPVRYWLRQYDLKTKGQEGFGKQKWNEDKMIDAIMSSVTISDVLKKMGLSVSSGNYVTVKKFIRKNGINVAHLTGKKSGRGISPNKKKLHDVLVENSDYARHRLKARLLQGGLLKNECLLCGQGPEWNGRPLVLILDHSNGVNNDNRIGNLRMLCPHCNSQQSTFAGRNKK